MKVLSIFGTRPEIIRLALLFRRLDEACEHVMVHTGQNYDDALSDVFFRDLRIRKPDRHLGVRAASFAGQVAQILEATGTVLEQERPDRIVVLGDTNSALSAIVAARMGIPVFHLEAGNRCFDDRVPEEINRRIVDQCSAVLMPYTQRSMENLVREGIERDRIYIIGNPIFEVMNEYTDDIERSDILTRLSVVPGGFLLVTMHRAENVDVGDHLRALVGSLEALATRFKLPVLVSTHPRTADRMKKQGIQPRDGDVRLLDPLGFFDFAKLERSARCVVTDSGTVQEECAILRIPNVTIREVTERPETIEAGSNILGGLACETVVPAVELALSSPPTWDPPPEYLATHVASKAARIILGYLGPRILRTRVAV